MSAESTLIQFPGLLAAGQVRGRHSRPWQRRLDKLQIAVDGIPPSTADLVFQLVIDGVAQAQLYTLTAGQTFIEIGLTGGGLTVSANAVVGIQCDADGGAADVNVTLIGTNKLFGDAQFGDADCDGSDATITTFLTADDVANYIPASKLIEALDDPVNPAGTLNTTKRDALITRVNGEMWSALAKRHKRPLVVPCDMVNEILGTCGGFALNIFWYYALADKPHILEAFKGVAKQFDDAKDWLDGIATGKRTLGPSRATPGAEARTVESNADAKTFTRDRLRGW